MIEDDEEPARAAPNRLPMPEGVQGDHFLYRTLSPAFCDDDVATVVAGVKKLVEEHGLYCAQVEVYHRRQLENGAPEAVGAFDRLVARLPAICHGRSLSLLVCEWAAPHVDDSYEGSAFFSAVLHTGPHPYVMQTMHTEPDPHNPVVQRLTTNTRTLAAGQAIVFDPTMSHFAAPKFPDAEQLLVLLQVELDDADGQARQKLLEALPPLAEDKDEANVFSMFG